MPSKLLKNGAVLLYSEEDDSLVASANWSVTQRGYVGAILKKKNKPEYIYFHRAVLKLKPHTGTRVEHINGNLLDNRRENLRKHKTPKFMLVATTQLAKAEM